MRIVRTFPLMLSILTVLGMPGCGGSLPEVLVSIKVTPSNGSGTANSSSSSVQFTATGSFAPPIPSGGAGTGGVNIVGSPDKTQRLTNAMWTSSDQVNAPINSTGLAVCAGLTGTTATITASAPGYTSGSYATVSGTATLTLQLKVLGKGQRE